MAALIRGMAAAGAPPEAIALAVEAIEAAQSKVRPYVATPPVAPAGDALPSVSGEGK